MTTVTIDAYEAMTVDLPEGKSGPVAIERFEITESDVKLAAIRIGGGRGYTRPGTYTRLMRGERLWMSDTRDEKRDHLYAIYQAQRMEARTALIGGLGLGMVVRALILATDVQEIDVVEIDRDVIAVAGQYYIDLAAQHGKVVRIIHGDVGDRKRFVPDRGWDWAWFDIWKDLSVENLTEMGSIARQYGSFAIWKGYWGKEYVLRQRDRDRRMSW